MAETLTAKLHWQGDAAFAAESGSGHQLLMDGPPDHGGQNRGSRPMEILLIGLAGCASFDVVDILRRGRAEVSDCETRVLAKRADQIPAVFTHIELHFRVSGNNLREQQVARAVELSAEKYCSASIMLTRGGVEISHHFEVVQQ